MLFALILAIASRAAGQCSQWVVGALNPNSNLNFPINDIISFDLDAGGPEPARLIAATSHNVWVWDGANWKSMREEIFHAHALVVFNGSLVTAGVITINNGQDYRNAVLRWNGNGWVVLGQYFGTLAAPKIRALTVYQGELIAAGSFEKGPNGQHRAMERDNLAVTAGRLCVTQRHLHDDLRS